ncbi:MAG TPA: transporter substrate-binding domain-containing protein [Opitutaceae bacterium]|nr:transporter substrate-binding domain-containing protein [Opitutaceae bacterium]
MGFAACVMLTSVAKGEPFGSTRTIALRVGVEAQSEPFTFASKSGAPAGFCIDLLNAAAADQRLRLQFTMLSWADLLQQFKDGNLDVISNIAYTPDRAAYADFTIPSLTLEGAMFVRKGLPPIRSDNDIRKLRVAVGKDTMAYQFLHARGLDANIVPIQGLRACLEKVNDGNVDATFGVRLIGEKYIHDADLENVAASEYELSEFKYEFHAAVQKGDADLLYRLNLGLAHVRESGRFDQLVEQWLGPIQPRHILWRDVAPYWLPLLAITAILALAFSYQRRLMRQLRARTEALRTSEERLRLALAGSREAVWDWNVPSNTVVRSERWAEIIGCRLEEISPNIDALNPRLHPDDATRVQNFKRQMLDGESHLEYRVRARDGSWRWLFDRGAVVERAGDGTPLRVTGIATDITFRKETEEALERSQLLLQQSQETAQIGGWELDVVTQEMFWTREAHRIYEVDTPPARITLDWTYEFLSPTAQTQLKAAIDQAAKTGASFEIDVEIITAKSRLSWVRVTGRAVRVGDRVVRVHGSYQDISKQKRSDEERQKIQLKMLEAQKLESLGVLAGGIAHDFNNLLTVILGNTSLAREDPGTVSDALDQIEVASQRAADLCRQMLAYAGKGRFTVEVLDLNAVVADTVQLLKLSISKNATLDFAFGDSELPIEADTSQIRQVVMNLVINASEALGGASGRIRISTTAQTVSKERLREATLGQELPSGEYVSLEIEDNGCGMSSDTMARIFDPFFTTKFTGRGLGLAAVVGVIRAHHGALFVRSTLGHGTTFQILVPRSSAKISPVKEFPARPNRDTSSRGTILLVDDEPNVRRVASALLEKNGYTVAVAADGYEALALALAHGGRFVAVLLDLTMPGLDGPATLKELRAINAATPILLMSGYTESDARQRLPADQYIAFLPKPFTSDELLEALRELLVRTQSVAEKI